MLVPIVVLVIVLLLIAIRQIGNFRMQIWQIMLFGALAVLITGQITPIDAFHAINLDVMFFLFGMFIVGQALEDSNYLAYLSNRIFRKAKNIDVLLLMIIFVTGFLSALLLNDTVAIIGVPFMLLIAKKHRIEEKILLLALMFSVTVGSVMSPIGNPQNLLIALNSGMVSPFTVFFRNLLLPTIINLFVVYLLIKLFYRKELKNIKLNHVSENITDKKLSIVARISLYLVVCLIHVKVLLNFIYPSIDIRLTYIALIAALPVLIYRIFAKKYHLMRKLDWFTLVFFASMFVLMESVWQTGFFQGLIENAHVSITTIFAIMIIGILLSQLISNVPLVALYLPLLVTAGVSEKGFMALAAGSTIAGNLFILGAASNVIIIQNAERKAGVKITFWDFARIGIPLTIVNFLVYWVFFAAL